MWILLWRPLICLFGATFPVCICIPVDVRRRFVDQGAVRKLMLSANERMCVSGCDGRGMSCMYGFNSVGREGSLI